MEGEIVDTNGNGDILKLIALNQTYLDLIDKLVAKVDIAIANNRFKFAIT